MVDIRELGVGHELVPYTEALALQRRTHAGVVAREIGGTVLLLEHPSVYTAGKRTDPSERPDDGTPVIDVDRGGKITWHGPGQLVGYPIVRLPEPIDVVQYVRDLESVLIAVLSDLGVDARRVAGRSGAWVGEPGAEDKIAAIGIRVADGVSMHGFALNCSNSLDAYARIVACGIRDAGVTTISQVVGREVTPAEALPFVEERLAQLFERWVDDRAAADRLVSDRAAAARAAAAIATSGAAA